MSNPAVLDWRKINVARDFRYAAEPKKGSHDGYSLSVRVVDPNSDEERNFVHQAPEMSLSFGFVEKEVSGKMNYKAPFAFTTVRYDPGSNKWTGSKEMLDYLKFHQDIDAHNQEVLFKNQKQWFGTQKKKEIIDEFYFKNVWIGDKCLTGEYPPTLSTKLWVRDGAFVTKFYNDKKQQITYDDVKGDASKGLRCIPLLRSTGLWFAGKNNGMSFQVVQLLIFSREEFVGCAIDIGHAADFETPQKSITYDDSDIANSEESLIDTNKRKAEEGEEEGDDNKRQTRSKTSNFNMPEEK